MLLLFMNRHKYFSLDLSNNNLSVTTVFYRFNKYANYYLIGYVLVLFWAVFNPLRLSGTPLYIWLAIFLLFPVYLAIGKNSFFYIRKWDERKLIISSNGIYVGDSVYRLSEIEAVAVTLHSFHDFVYSVSSDGEHEKRSEYGDQNYLSFRSNGEILDFQFFIKDYQAYKTLYVILNGWMNSNKSMVCKQSFPIEFFDQQIARYISLK